MGPHERSGTVEVMAANEQVPDKARFDTDPAGFAAMLVFVVRSTTGVWAIEVCAGIGRPLRPV